MFLRWYRFNRSVRAVKLIKTIALLVMSGAMVACQNPRLELEQLTLSHSYTLSSHTLADLPIVQLSPAEVSVRNQRLRVYIEGDGRAWITRSQPSLDPTPHNLFIAQFAIDDPQPSVYLGRPCQFSTNQNCTVSLWTSARFGTDVLTTMHLALDQLRTKYQNTEFELVGYSGGAAIALLLAAQRDDVKQVQTIAGNLSPALWAQFHNLTVLSGSQDPMEYAEKLQSVKQRHFVGSLDKNISLELFSIYIKKLSPIPRCIELVEVQHADHSKGWDNVLKMEINHPIRCLSHLNTN